MGTASVLGKGRSRSLTLRILADLTTGAVFACGVLAIDAHAQPSTFAMYLIAAGLLDIVDGALARRAGGPTAHGAVLDIVADWVTFGLAPIVLSVAHQRLDVIGTVSLAVFGLAALTRLVRAGRDFRQRHIGHLGLPMPAAGGLIVGFSLLLPSSALPFGIVLVAFLAVTKRRYPSFQSLWRQDPMVLVVVGAIGVAMTIFSWETAWLTVSVAYAAYPWIKGLRSRFPFLPPGEKGARG